MQNRRKYDPDDIRAVLVAHEQHDAKRFSLMGKRLIRIEFAIYGAAVALGLFTYLIDHPKIITNLTASQGIISPAIADSTI